MEEFEATFMSILDPPVTCVVGTDTIIIKYVRAHHQHTLFKVCEAFALHNTFHVFNNPLCRSPMLGRNRKSEAFIVPQKNVLSRLLMWSTRHMLSIKHVNNEQIVSFYVLHFYINICAYNINMECVIGLCASKCG